MKSIAILGSTGSLGRQALEVIAENKERLKVVALSAKSNYRLLIEQARIFNPLYVCYQGGEDIKSDLPVGTVLISGENALIELCAVAEYDTLLSTVVGISGLLPTIEAVKRGKTVALANKETLVCAGGYIMRLARQYSAQILPVDSEHSAIAQCLCSGKASEVEKLILTASGGAFRNIPIELLAEQKPEDALKHPNWDMGAKITIDCATMVNKGFEVMEAMHLFDMPISKIDVVMHIE
ncbi:MAG: 1-deoxy-D-xylulose-5-phosphate reductoisomerase, partial [Clostridia bacterium]|nr:1-deoxy-D-xylulose-5-phosphate reductoisomerase [Clostridia bacterium]